MMENIFTYVRSWFPDYLLPSRKRKLPGNSYCRSPKYPRLLSAMADSRLEDDLFSSTPLRRSTHSSPLNGIQISDEEDNLKQRTSSEDSIYYKGEWTSSDEKRSTPGAYTHISRYTTKPEPILMPNLTPSRVSLPVRTPLTRNRAKSRQSLDYSIRLEDKERYEQLLEKVSPRYTSPPRFNANVSRKQTPVEIVDLTADVLPRKLSTKQLVQKVVEDFDRDEVAIVDDSDDSEVEILPTPPSPKPDIKVDPINSLKTVVDTSEVSKSKWLAQYSRNHDRYVEDKAREIQLYGENALQLSGINREIQIQNLVRKVENGLRIKSSILPEIVIEDEEVEFPELTAEHMKMIKGAFTGNPNQVLTKKYNLDLSRNDIQRLSNLNWLNDNVVNFYMNLIMERSTTSDKYPKTYCMNTFFYERLLKTGPESLRRWTKKVDIFSFDFVCVPIHLGMHWCMAVIYMKERAIKYYDSMGHANNQCLKALKHYLEYEHQDKKGTPYSTSDYHLENVKEIPQQMNGSDCGMFACCFAEYTARGRRFTFKQEHMPYLRKKMVVEILTGQLLIT